MWLRFDLNFCYSYCLDRIIQFVKLVSHMDLVPHFNIRHQPDDSTCGPTCLQAVYQFYGDPISLGETIVQVPQLGDGGTLAVYLACHALKRGYRATIIPFNLKVFDPTWSQASADEIAAKLKQQKACKKEPELQTTIEAYIEYLEFGGRLKFEVLTAGLLRRYLKRSIPIMTGLSSTYLYQSSREYEANGRLIFDDVRGESAGHFVVLSGYDREERTVLVADPLDPNPMTQNRYYHVNIYRLICAIMLGVLTYDGNLLVIEPKNSQRTSGNIHRPV